MADWSQLPPELLTLIAERLETRFDVLRFRSVCSSWRSSSPPETIYPLPKHIYISSKPRFIREYTVRDVIVTTDTVFLVRLPGVVNHSNPTPPACWLVKIGDGISRVKVSLLNPFSGSVLGPDLLVDLPKVLDLTNFQVVELGHQFFVQYAFSFYHDFMPLSLDHKKEVEFLRSSTNSDDFVMLGYLFGCLGFLRSGESNWTLLKNAQNAHDTIHDIISFNGKFYAIDKNGKTVVVDQSLNVGFIEPVGSSVRRKYLVQSGDNLLAVEMPLYLTPVNRDSSVRDKVAGFRIFKLDEEVQKWDEIESLGDQILFLGWHHAISASASEFYWEKGNLIFYSSPEHLFVFDLDTGTVSPLRNCPAYRNLFWPPPKWVTSLESVISL
ncbi:hypothetical protein PTKIN_Ptkin02bG0219300 [Pterospermum kingtungense]